MNILKTTEELIEYRKSLKGSVGFVPTMGALHKGHKSLIDKSISENDFTIVSIFVNPTQFLAGEDLDKYPRKPQADEQICRLCRVDAIFAPQICAMYGDEEVLVKALATKGFILEGFKRPGHFDGVLQVVLKLFNLVRPTSAYFGKKDAQQLYLIQKMASDLFLDVNIVPCDIVRDEDGLALSSRNVYLSPSERLAALAIPHSLKRLGKMIMEGERCAKKLKNGMLDVLSGLDVEYVEIVDRNFNKIDNYEKNSTIVLVAAKVGNTRLIDNVWI